MFDQEEDQRYCPQCWVTKVLERLHRILEPPLCGIANLQMLEMLLCDQIERQTGWIQYVFDPRPGA
jgi:hypothetical protein